MAEKYEEIQALTSLSQQPQPHSTHPLPRELFPPQPQPSNSVQLPSQYAVVQSRKLDRSITELKLHTDMRETWESRLDKAIVFFFMFEALAFAIFRFTNLTCCWKIQSRATVGFVASSTTLFMCWCLKQICSSVLAAKQSKRLVDALQLQREEPAANKYNLYYWIAFTLGIGVCITIAIITTSVIFVQSPASCIKCR